MSVLSVVDMRKRFGEVQALDGCSLSVARGRMLGFLGPNGAGKTTVMRTVFGVVEPDSGEVLWDGRPIGLEERLRFGYMPEERGLYPRMPVADQLAYFGTLHGLSDAAAGVAAARWIDRLGLSGRADATVEELSHGNQQRAQLAAALLHEPELLVLDEPFAGLDPVAVQMLADVLRGEAARGAAVLFSSHQLELVEDICAEVAIVDRGRVVTTGNVDALRRASRRRRIELQLEGSPAAVAAERRRSRGRRPPQRRPTPAGRPGRRPRAGPRRGRASGRVVAFSYGPPSLAELFLELVAR